MCGGVVHDVLVATGYDIVPEYFNPTDDSGGMPSTPSTGLDKLPHGFTKKPVNVGVENFNGYSYMDAYDAVAGAADNVAAGVPQTWTDVSQAITSATENFQTELDALNSGPDSWAGASAQAALQNLASSFYIPAAVSSAANVLSTLSQAFSNTMATTKGDITSNLDSYNMDVDQFPEQVDSINQQYASYAQSVLAQAYQPTILTIAANNPSLDQGPAPTVQPIGATSSGSIPAATGGLGDSGTTAFVGGAAGASAPTDGANTSLGTPENGPPTVPRAAQTTPGSSGTSASPSPAVPSTPTPAAASDSDLNGLSGLGSGLQGLGSPLQSALGQAMNAGQKAGGPGGAHGPSNLPPEGALAKGLKGGGGAGAGGGAGPAMSRPAGAPATAAGIAGDRTVAGGSRAALSGAPGGVGAGAPAAGAPGGGQHGAGAHGGQHQPSKVLRRKKNGEDIVGDTQAVVAVLGETPRTDAPKPPDAS